MEFIALDIRLADEIRSTIIIHNLAGKIVRHDHYDFDRLLHKYKACQLMKSIPLESSYKPEDDTTHVIFDRKTNIAWVMKSSEFDKL